MKNIPFFLLLFTSLAFTSCSRTETAIQTPIKGSTVPVKIINLEKGTFNTTIQASGNFSTKDETLLSFKVGGIVSKVLVQEGEAIQKGQLLATLDLTEIQAGLNQAKLAYEKALRDYERAGRLYKDSVATLEQFQNSKTALDIAEQQLKASEFNLGYSQIKATQNGYVLKKFVNAGQQVSSGAPVLQINGANQGNWVLQATVNDQNWSQIAPEDAAIILLENSRDSIPSKVIRKSQAADPMTGSYWVEVALENSKDLQLASGMFGRVIIRPSTQLEGWQIPYEALLDAQGGEGFVFVTDDQTTAKKIKVRLGKISPSTIQVVSGLENHTSLIVSGSAYLTEGSTIFIQN
jgi:RND family efflux transporter MFP subunit